MQEKTKSTLGFQALETEWDIYKNKPVCVHSDGNTVHGVVNYFDLEKNYVYLNPLIVINIQGTRIRLEKEKPTMIPAQRSIVRPLEKGELENFIEEFNKAKEESERKIILP